MEEQIGDLNLVVCKREEEIHLQYFNEHISSGLLDYMGAEALEALLMSAVQSNL